MGKQPRAHLAIICLLYLLLGLVDTIPLAGHFSGGVPYTRFADPVNPVQHGVHGDHLQLYYRFWLFTDALSGNSPFFRNKYEFNTGDGTLRPLSAYFMPYPLFFLVFGFFGRGAGYNAVILSSYLLSGLSMYLLVHHYTRDRLAAFLAGAVFAAVPYRSMSVLSGHPAGLSMFLLPLFIYAVEKLLATKSVRYALLGGMIFLVMGDNDLQVLYLTVLAAPFFVLRHLAGVGWKRAAGEVRGLVLPALPLIAMSLLSLTVMSFLSQAWQSSGGAPVRSLGEIRAYAPALGEALVRSDASQPTSVYLGAAATLFSLLLFAAAAVRSLSSAADQKVFRLTAFFLVLLLVSYMLSFGPRFPLRLPYLLLYEHLPKFSSIRQTAKLMVVATFALSVLTGLGFASLRRYLPGRRGALATVTVTLLILADYSPLPGPGVGISVLPVRAQAYERVFGGRPGARVVNVPIWPGNDAWSSHYQYYTTVYRTVMINGYNPLPPPGYRTAVFQPLISLNAGQVQEKQYRLLRELDVDYLVFHEESFPPKVCLFPSQYALDNLRASPYLQPAASDPPISIFRLRDDGGVPPEEVRFRSSVTGVVHQEGALGGGEIITHEGSSNGRVLLLRGGKPARVEVRRRTTPAGSYTLLARVKSEGPAGFVLSASRSRDGSRIKSERFELSGGGTFVQAALDFSLPEAQSVFYLLEKPPPGVIALDWIYLRFSDRKDPPVQIEFEDLFHTGNLVPHKGASRGRAVLLTGTDPAGEATRGPYRLFGPGTYEMTVSLSLAGNGPPAAEPVSSVTVRNSMDRSARLRDRPPNVILPEQVLKSADFKERNLFNDFTYRFTLDRPDFLSVNIRHFRHSLYLDRVMIVKAGE